MEEESEDRDEYWDMAHHKFEWSDYVQALDPRSWHALGIAVQESFISKGRSLFLGEGRVGRHLIPGKIGALLEGRCRRHKAGSVTVKTQC